ncbi:MAG: hypothetical protein ACRDTH_00805 [Pseudonocardiaceae bacterium]
MPSTPQQVCDRDEVAAPGAQDGHGELACAGQLVCPGAADAQHGRRGKQVCRDAQGVDLLR